MAKVTTPAAAYAELRDENKTKRDNLTHKKLIPLLCFFLFACSGQGAQPGVDSVASAGRINDLICQINGQTYCVLNPAVTQDTINSTICVSGWTATIRPPVKDTNKLKAQQIADFKLAGNISDYEEDHRMPLELGGAPSDVHNLSPEFPKSPNAKDADETALKRLVCEHRILLSAAQIQLVGKWLGIWPTYKA